uniref:F-box/LRR-repeat protein 15/At3g58940/PEG3-like LRR domain-containing protein n=1 Tax=Leersia perrieri TaxID=77586 RepID=A0A0D9X051_9ORYZ
MDTRYHSFRFLHGGAQPPPTTFAALRVLNIGCSVFHVSEMERLISSLCPRLQDLTLQTYFELEGVFNFSVRSETLERLDLRVSRVNGRLTVEAPRLVRLAVSEIFITPSLDPQHAARIAAPKLAEVSWYDVYDALRHQFVVAPRRLRKLQVRTCYMDERNMRWSKLAAGLLQRFDAVDELELDLDIVIGQIPYKLFLKDTAKLPECKVLKIRFISNCSELQHCASSTVMHLISKCTGITRLDIRLDRSLWFRQIGENLQQITCPTFRNRRGENNCPCWQPEDEITDGIILDSLEELYIINFTGADDEVDMVKLLLRCKLIPRRVAFRLPNDMNNEMCEKVREKITSLFLPNTKLEIYWNRTLLQKSKSIGIPNLFG